MHTTTSLIRQIPFRTNHKKIAKQFYLMRFILQMYMGPKLEDKVGSTSCPYFVFGKKVKISLNIGLR